MKKIRQWWQKFKSWKTWKKVAFVIAVLLAGYLISKNIITQYQANQPNYQTTTLSRGKIEDLVSETGEITATGRTEVKSTIQGIVEEVYVVNGDLVEQGDELFYVVSSATEAERISAWSAYQAAKTAYDNALTGQKSSQLSLEKARIDLLNASDSYDSFQESNQADYTQNQIDVQHAQYQNSQAAFAIAEDNYVSSAANIDSAKAKLNSAWLSYQATTSGPVKAPTSGEVNNLAIAPGQNVDVSTSDTTAANALVIKSDEASWIKIAVSEMEISKVRVGQTAKVTVDAVADKSFTAQVERVDAIGNNSGGIVTYGVYLLLNESDEAIRPLMTVQVDIEIEKKEGVLVLPSSAFKTYKGESAVQIFDEASRSLIYYPVVTGSSDDINTEIISGLEEGQEVVLSVSSDQTGMINSDMRAGFPGVMGGGR